MGAGAGGVGFYRASRLTARCAEAHAAGGERHRRQESQAVRFRSPDGDAVHAVVPVGWVVGNAFTMTTVSLILFQTNADATSFIPTRMCPLRRCVQRLLKSIAAVGGVIIPSPPL